MCNNEDDGQEISAFEVACDRANAKPFDLLELLHSSETVRSSGNFQTMGTAAGIFFIHVEHT